MLLPAETTQPLHALTASSRLATSSMLDQSCSNQSALSQHGQLYDGEEERVEERKKVLLIQQTIGIDFIA